MVLCPLEMHRLATAAQRTGTKSSSRVVGVPVRRTTLPQAGIVIIGGRFRFRYSRELLNP